MGDVVVTVPMRLWEEWVEEGDAAGEPPTNEYEYGFNLYGPKPHMKVGDRVYIVAHGKVRGYAPLVELEEYSERFGGRGHGFALVRRGGAVACTIPAGVRGFQGWRYRWWEYSDELPFPNWRTP
jgi:hypothetical protein